LANLLQKLYVLSTISSSKSGCIKTEVNQIAVSLISDLVPLRFVPLAESLLYVGVYVGEAISARISAVFKDEGKTWRLAFKAIGITGVVIAVVTVAFIREPRNRRKVILATIVGE